METGKAAVMASAAPAASPPAPDGELKARIESETRRKLRRKQLETNLGRIVLMVAFLAIWEIGSGRFLDEFFVSSPTKIIQSIYYNFAEKELLWHVQITVLETLAGYVFGALAAVALALLIGLSDRYYRMLEPFVIAFNGIPRIAIAPLFIMWFGIGLTPKIVIAALMVFFIVFMNTIAGIRSVNTNFVNISMLMGASRLQVIQKVVLPSAMQHILTSLKIVVPMAMTGAIVGEFISSQRGLGFFISRSTAMMDITSAFAGIIVLMVVLLLMNAGVDYLERKFARGQSREHSASGM
ncbi:ABC transporter permease [Xylanibacillus composti]|uniref:ABC transporter permease n=1 Tax=Xylanibacillus composti TaxID=1572762 RepID=A0A8J4H5K3_9BACL|nr:ABC transporter permease [Xylanibacillus composti]GIQ69957.1 ABC transporter permease [Xylanibacillus composti]